ncbi:MAG: bifunctional hydroxymethylpyrimidine kinase/phosphomethylpyrimidine kinase [Vicinamibacteria bacterium]|nr:bifunctional hydroxymethylpyrimidine kinase/phosphomethylpyrimidine kinase [Vicinamibacteria bacterium]
MKVALSIAGSDSGGGAGIQADLLTFAAHGVHGTCAITAITAQNTVAVTAWQAIEPRMVRAQIEAVADDMTLSALKTGMLANSAIIEVVASVIAARGFENLVVDPVMVAKSGDRLLDPAAELLYLERLFPLAALITPNIPEAEALLSRTIRSVDEMKDAARSFARLGCRAVLVKGGHLDGDPTDILWDGSRLHEFVTPRIDTRNTHGTGCTYSAAITARLAFGHDIETSVRGAKQYLTAAIQESYSPGKGHGPVRHLNSGAAAALARATGPHKKPRVY